MAQGAPVSLIFGRIKLGSKVLSQELETLDEIESNVGDKPILLPIKEKSRG